LRERVGAVLGELVDHGSVAFEVILETVGPQAGAEGLDLARLAGRQKRRARRELLDLMAVGLELHRVPGDAGEDRLSLALHRQRDAREAPFDAPAVHRADLTAQGMGDQLVAEAHADQGELAGMRLAEVGDLGLHPGVVLTDVLLATEADDAVDVVKVWRYGRGPVEVGAADVELQSVI